MYSVRQYRSAGHKYIITYMVIFLSILLLLCITHYTPSYFHYLMYIYYYLYMIILLTEYEINDISLILFTDYYYY